MIGESDNVIYRGKQARIHNYDSDGDVLVCYLGQEGPDDGHIVKRGDPDIIMDPTPLQWRSAQLGELRVPAHDELDAYDRATPDADFPGHVREDWKLDVEQDATQESYWDWVYERLMEQRRLQLFERGIYDGKHA